jgi:hypothetical protein
MNDNLKLHMLHAFGVQDDLLRVLAFGVRALDRGI